MMSIQTNFHEETTQSLGVPVGRATQELAAPFTDLSDAIAAEQGALQREVLLWQRWVRYVAIATMVLLSLALGAIEPQALVPLAIIGVCYTSIVMSTAWLLLQNPPRHVGRWYPSLILAADIAALAGICFLTSE